MSSLLPPRQLITSLISSIPSSTEPPTSNPIKDAPPATQKALLTLHVLFPNELLPALDLLDRNLITRLTVKTNHGQEQAQQRSSSDSRSLPHFQRGSAQERQGGSLRPPPSPSHGAGSDDAMVLDGSDEPFLSREGLPLNCIRGPHAQSQQQHLLLGNDAHHSDLPTPQNRDIRSRDPQTQEQDQDHSRGELRTPHPHHHGAPESQTPPHQQNRTGQEENPSHPPHDQHDLVHRQHAHHATTHTLRATAAFHAIWRCRSARGGETSRVSAPRHGDIRLGGDTVSGSGYEVRLDAWSCSCPAFAFKVVNLPSPGTGEEVHSQTAAAASVGWSFGGLGVGSDVPICKHLLACTLVEYCGAFQGLVEECEVSVEEIAGLAAGWAD